MLTEQVKEIKLLMEYAVPAGEEQVANDLLDRFSGDRIALNLLHSFYSFLPEGLDDAVCDLYLLARKEGVFLLAAATTIANYLYLVSQEQVEFLGNCDEGIWDDEVLAFFGFRSRTESVRTSESLTSCQPYIPANSDASLCPLCSAADGELHTLGCPVEVCPWCDGQLTSCNCRFTVSGKKHLRNETDLAAFHELLNEKGRIPYDALRQRPGYPGAGNDDP